jgi:hypothetical protein
MKKKILAAATALTLATGNAWGASACVGPQDELAMKTSSMQQALMVAALTCNDVAPYNRFVLSHQTELQQADAALMAFFVRENPQGGEADYHAFKTKAANVSSLASARDAGGYCANAARLFAAALGPYGANLAWFVSSQWQTTGEVIDASCTADATPARLSGVSSRSYGEPVPPGPVEPSLANGNPN